MTSKKILILSSCFYPNISPRSFRTTELAKELAKQGHDVTVYIRKEDYNYEQISTTHGVTIKDYGKFYLKKIQIKGVGVELWLRRAINRILLQFIEYPDIEYMFKVIKILKNETIYDLLISIAVPHPIHWGVALLRERISRITSIWIADCGDPYMLCETSNFKKLPYFGIIEKYFCSKTDFITVPTISSVAGYYSKYKSKIRVIPQGFCFDDISLYKDDLINVVPTFAYAGSFIPKKRDPQKFIEYLYSLNRDFHFIIYSNQHQMLSQYIDKFSNNIELKEFIERKELLYELSKMDFLVNFKNNTDIQTPSKIIDYSLTGRPILSVSDEGLETIIINEFLDGNYEHSFCIDNIKKYNIKNVAKDFLELC